jgi:hypothetical protein
MTPSREDVRLWPAALLLGVIAVIAAAIVALGVFRDDLSHDEGVRGPMTIVLAVPHGEELVRVVTREGGCKEPVSASVVVRADAVELRVSGRASGGCTAEIKLRCREVALPEPLGRRRLLPTPSTDRSSREAAEALIAAGRCVRLRPTSA